MKFFCIFIIFIISGCSIQKRHYQSGWDVQWKKKYNVAGVQENQQAVKSNERELIADSDFAAELDSISIFSNQTDTVVETENLSNNNFNLQHDIQNQLLSMIQSRQVLGLTSNLKDKISTHSAEIVKEKVMTYNGFFWLMLIPYIILLAAGICALIFGNHWIWIVIGVFLIVFSVFMTFMTLMVKMVGREFWKGVRK